MKTQKKELLKVEVGREGWGAAGACPSHTHMIFIPERPKLRQLSAQAALPHPHGLLAPLAAPEHV